MKVLSTKEPCELQFDKVNNSLIVTFCANIQHTVIESPDEENTDEYTYDRYQIVIPFRDKVIEDIKNDTQAWLEQARTAEEEKLSSDIRAKRNQLLEETDKEFCLDRILPSSVSTTALTAKLRELANGGMARYRQALRDLPQQEGFPYGVVFPVKPE